MLPAAVKRHEVDLAGVTVDTPEGPRHGPTRTLPAYVEESLQVVPVDGGSEAVSTVQVWLDPVEVGIGDTVTYAGRPLRVLSLDRYENSPLAHVALKLG